MSPIVILHELSGKVHGESDRGIWRMLQKVATSEKRIVALTYQSGEEIQRGDRVTYGGNAGTIELVVEGLAGDSDNDWLFENHGSGVMVVEPKVFGRVYLHAPHDEEDLLFVGRAE